MSALAPEGCFYVWPDGLHASHTCLEEVCHVGDHICTCGDHEIGREHTEEGTE